MNPPSFSPRRIVLILPCCIGDVVLATAALKALRRGWPDAHITWAAGSWSRGVIEHHDLLDAVLDTGPEALPVRSIGGFWRFVHQLRAGKFDLAVSLVRSPLMSAAVRLSGISNRAGLDSAGRGFGYTIRAPIDPHTPRHEAEIYLDVPRTLGLDTRDCWANVPVSKADRQRVRAILTAGDVREPFVVINPAGGRNPGMVMDSKRWPPENFARLADWLAEDSSPTLILWEEGRTPRTGRANPAVCRVVLLGGPGDAPIVQSVQAAMKQPSFALVGGLSFGEIAMLASMAALYVGNDTGLTHLAAAAGAKTAMILGPSDPARYAPFTPDALALWKPTPLSREGVAAGALADWDWARDGISVEEVERNISEFLGISL